MKGDFSRLTFNPNKHFSRVLMQQGRVLLDADWNEQSDLFLHHLRLLTRDLIGPHAGPAGALGFEIKPLGPEDFSIGAGRYYVDGILCENEAPGLTFRTQTDYPQPQEGALSGGRHLVYLDVWERHITWVEDDSIREKGLGGPDTATRAKVVWQVKTLPLSERAAQDCQSLQREWESLVRQLWQPENRGRLKARAKITEGDDAKDPSTIPPGPGYRGSENRLYRVEIHRAGEAWAPDEAGGYQAATFKWSRDNGSIVFPIQSIEGGRVTLEQLGRSGDLGLQPGDLVEVLEDGDVLRARPGLLLEVLAVDQETGTVDLALRAGQELPGYEAEKHPLLRVWDHAGDPSGDPEAGRARRARDSALALQEGAWLHLEDGVQIYFEPAPGGGTGHVYRTGDYWLIPARTETADVEWPRGKSDRGELAAKALPPHGVPHHFAPLAILEFEGRQMEVRDCRCQFGGLRECRPGRGLLAGFLRWVLARLEGGRG